MVRAALESLLWSTGHGQRPNGTFKTEAWNRAVSSVQNAVSEPSKRDLVTKPRVRMKIEGLKRDYKAWKAYSNNSGFSVDVDGRPTADREVLDEYFSAHPEARQFRDRPLQYRDELSVLFDGTLATGNNALPLREQEVPIDDDMPGLDEISWADSEVDERAAGGNNTSSSSTQMLGSPSVSSPALSQGSSAVATAVVRHTRPARQRYSAASQVAQSMNRISETVSDTFAGYKDVLDAAREDRLVVDKAFEVLNAQFGSLEPNYLDAIGIALEKPRSARFFSNARPEQRIPMVQRWLKDKGFEWMDDSAIQGAGASTERGTLVQREESGIPIDETW